MVETPERLFEIVTSNWIRKILVTAVELDIFTKIENGLDSAEKIADDLRTTRVAVEKILDACTSMDFLVKNGNVYGNSDMAKEFLVKGLDSYFGDYILAMDVTGKKLDLLKDTILNGSQLDGISSKEVFENQSFTRAMHNVSYASAKILSEKVDFSNRKNLLDVGGGSGVYPIILTNKYENLKATVLELPKVCEVAQEYIDKLGDVSRVKTLAGDYLNDNFSKDFDVILLSLILHSNSVKECKMLIKKSYDALEEGGEIIINEFLLDEDKAGPLIPAVFSVIMFLETKAGSSYTENEIKGWLEEVGFKDLRIINLAGPQTAIVARK